MIRLIPPRPRRLNRDQKRRQWRRRFVLVRVVFLEDLGNALVVGRMLETRWSQTHGRRLWRLAERNVAALSATPISVRLPGLPSPIAATTGGEPDDATGPALAAAEAATVPTAPSPRDPPPAPGPGATPLARALAGAPRGVTTH